MSAHSIDLQVLFPSIKKDGRPLPCAVLLKALESAPADRRRFRWSSPNAVKVLELAGLLYQFSELLLEAMGEPLDTPGIAIRRVWNPALRTRAIDVPVAAIHNLRNEDRLADPFGRVHRFLDAIQADQLNDLLAWAPPIFRKVDEQYWVVANRLSSLIHAHLQPQGKQRGYLLIGKAPAIGSITPVCQATHRMLSPILSIQRDQLVRRAKSLDRAMTASGLSRSRCAELRSQ